jgi:hypothetical protein
VEEEELVEAVLAVGTDQWCEFQVPMTTKRARGCWVQMHAPKVGSEEEMEAQKWWPVGRDFQPWSIGAWMEEVDMKVEEGTKWKAE